MPREPVRIEPEGMNSLNDFLKDASKNGIEAALEKGGEIINGREAAALKKLSPQDLKQLVEINDRINGLAGVGPLSDWSCGIVC